MDSVILYSHPVMQCRTYQTQSKQLLGLRTGKSFLIIQDITPNGPTAFLSRRDAQFMRSSMKTKEDEDDNSAPLRSRKEKDKLARQEEIISLFRRIQSSISKGEKTGTDVESLEDDKEKPAAESVLEIIRRSRKNANSKIQANQANREKTKSSPIRKMAIPKKEKDVKIRDFPPISNLEVPRPPSNFLKRSPIPFPSAPRGKANDPGEGNRFGLQKLEGMKLAELKELAKSRGLKGYSKLKKTELVQLLILLS